MIVRLLRTNYGAENLIADAYGICTNRDVPVENIPKWIGMGHETPIEHVWASFLFGGISRACSHQIVRHRLASYSQESQRYVKMEDPRFIIPPTIEQNDIAYVVYNDILAEIQYGYEKLVSLGIPKEDARFLLPNATPTRMMMTANFREWRHFIKLRTDPAAQWEIREVANRVKDILVPLTPNVFGDL